jgi:hypothetical protein
MRQALLLGVALAFGATASACAPAATATDSPPPTVQGRSAASVTAKFGPPEIRQQSDGRTAYLWTSATRAPATPVPSTRVSYATGRPNTIETLSYPDPPEMESCTLRAVVDGAGQIVSSDWEGSRAGCHAMSQRLTSP